MFSPISQTEEALRDTSIRKAEGRAFDSLARLYGLSRIRAFRIAPWRRGLRALALGPRGTLGATHDALEAFLADYGETFAVSVDPLDPTTVLIQGASPDFRCDHLGRFVRLELPIKDSVPDQVFPEDGAHLHSGIFWTQGPAITDAGSFTLELVPVKTAYWEGANWLTGPWAVDAGGVNGTLTVLPFVYVEPTPGPIEDAQGNRVGTASGRPCLFQLLTDFVVYAVPPSYLLDPGGVDRANLDPNMPIGAHLMDLFNLDGDQPPPPPDGDQVDGPFPIYLIDDVLPSGIGTVIDLTLAAGVKVEERVYNFCPDEAAAVEGQLDFSIQGNPWLIWWM